MAPATTLTIAEIRLIKGMLQWAPELTDQVIMSYFSRPWRDLNHRIVGEIRNGWRWPKVPEASLAATLAYMAIAGQRQAVPAEQFVRSSPPPVISRAIVRVELDWWPAGQGLFASGVISGMDGEPFNWVYDCGTESKLSYLHSSIDRFASQQNGWRASTIRLAVLSHFDNDHLSGLLELISKFPIDTLLLPYMPRWQRLMLAFEMGVSGADAEFGFYVDPVAYLAQAARGRIGEIVIVPQTGPDDVPDPPDDSPEPPEGSSGEVRSVKVEYGDPPLDASDDMAAGNSTTRVRYLRPAGRIIVPGLWEFVPYNDGQLASKIGPRLTARINRLRSIFLNCPRRRAKALARLKLIYNSTFRGSVQRNQISLFLYSGPIRSARYAGKISATAERFVTSLRCSQMHTGDGYLTIGARYDAFDAFFRPGGRISRSAFFQVMHHGAKGNWHDGVAAKLNPEWSIFSSEPNGHYDHPDAPVLRDFWRFHPVQVDTMNGLHVSGVVFVP